MPNISMSFNMDVDDLVESIVDSGYALAVIKTLLESLKVDYTEDEMKQLIKELSEI